MREPSLQDQAGSCWARRYRMELEGANEVWSMVEGCALLAGGSPASVDCRTVHLSGRFVRSLTALDESHDRRVLNKARARLHQLCEECGIDSRCQEEDQPGTISFRLLRGLLIADDPDAEVFGAYATGVGVGLRMPRTPAVYDPKQKWKLLGQRIAHLYREELNGSGVEQGNGKSGEAFPEEVERELRESVKLDSHWR